VSMDVRHLRSLLGCLTLAAAVACGGGEASPSDAAAAPDLPAAPPPTPQRPPRGDQAAMEAWLAEGHYLTWHCEDAVSPPRGLGGHGRQRICSNDVLLASASGPYPVDSASVKPMYGAMDQPNGFSVGLKVIEGPGAFTWYWYERLGASPTAPAKSGVGIPDCAVCHQQANRDYVFFRAP
jgi:hypothetical protein